MTRPLTAAADPSRPIPAHAGARIDAIQTAEDRQRFKAAMH